VVVVEEDVDLYPSLGPSEFCPGEDGEAKGDGGGVKGEELVLESEPGFSVSESALGQEMFMGCIEEVLIKVGGPVQVWRRRGLICWVPC
jgi:hypothetical protein